MCFASYINLQELVSHVRASHNGLSLVCQVNHCSKTFSNGNSWYRHVLKYHRVEYLNEISDSESSNDDDILSDTPSECSSGVHDHESYPDDAMSPDEAPSEGPMTISKEEIAGKLLRIKEKYLISNAGVDEIMELVESVCDRTCASVLSATFLSGEACGLNTTSNFFLQLPELLDSVKSPLATIRTTYRQHSYIAQNLPYVVSYNT